MQIELHELVAAIGGKAAQPLKRNHGVALVIADRGHVWVGEVETDGEWCIVRRANVVRQWGTTRGLGEIAHGGPTQKTVLDPIGEVRVVMHAVIAVVPCEGARWKL
jgi:hypothetical protein